MAGTTIQKLDWLAAIMAPRWVTESGKRFGPLRRGR